MIDTYKSGGVKRTFVSIDLPKFIEHYLETLRHKEIRWIKWMNPGNLHITLSFLGELDAAKIQKAQTAIEAVAATHQPFQLKFAKLLGERDMLWLVPDESRELFDLQKALQGQLRAARVGKRERREYLPHILLAKSKTGRPMSRLRQGFGGQDWLFEPFAFIVDKIHLYESRLTPGSATHILIETFPMTPTISPPHENRPPGCPDK